MTETAGSDEHKGKVWHTYNLETALIIAILYSMQYCQQFRPIQPCRYCLFIASSKLHWVCMYEWIHVYIIMYSQYSYVLLVRRHNSCSERLLLLQLATCLTYSSCCNAISYLSAAQHPTVLFRWVKYYTCRFLRTIIHVITKYSI